MKLRELFHRMNIVTYGYFILDILYDAHCILFCAHVPLKVDLSYLGEYAVTIIHLP